MEERFLVLLLKFDSFLDFFFRALHSLSFPKLLTDLEVWSKRRAASLILCLLYFLSFSSWDFNCLFSSLYYLLTISEFSSSDKTLHTVFSIAGTFSLPLQTMFAFSWCVKEVVTFLLWGPCLSPLFALPSMKASHSAPKCEIHQW